MISTIMCIFILKLLLFLHINMICTSIHCRVMSNHSNKKEDSRIPRTEDYEKIHTNNKKRMRTPGAGRLSDHKKLFQ